MGGRIQLLLGGTFEDTWREVARPWFAAAAKTALSSTEPWVVLAPSRAWGHALKARLVAEGLDLGGVFFWTPGEMRDHLRHRLADAPALAVREHLHLLLAAVAERSDTAPGRNLAREPGRLLRSLDQLTAAGHDARALGFAPAEKLAGRFAAALRESGWTTVQAYDWQLAHHPPEGAVAALLVLGFDAAHWELWPLLHAAARASHACTVVLVPPRSKAELLDQAWIGTWEQAFDAAEPVPAAGAPSPFANLAHRMENPEGAAKAPAGAAGVEVLVGRNAREQAGAIVAQCLAFLHDPRATRIGVLFPGPGPLSREVSAQLLRYGIPHFDAFGHAAPPPSTALRLHAWVALQHTYRVEPLLRLLDLDADAARPERFEEMLDRAYGDVLVDDLPVVSARLRDLGRPDHLEAARFLARYPRLPAESTLGGMLDATRAAWSALGWTDLLAEVDAQALHVAPLKDRPLTLAAWMDWLSHVAPGAPQVRDADAANPLAVVHLLAYAQAEGLPWSHLVMADLNEGHWPPGADPAGFLSDDRIAELNAGALEQGRQGEGHVTARAGRSLILGSAERRDLDRRQFYNLVEAAGVGLALACALESESDSGRVVPPGSFLSHLYFTAFGEPLTEARMQDLRTATADWLARLPPPPRVEPPEQPSAIDQAAAAHRARRAAQAFGPYECAFAKAPPPHKASLSCKEWERAVGDPAGVWLSLYLGVSPAGDFSVTDRWPLTRGTWVHRWLAEALCPVSGRFEQRARGPDIAARVRRAAAATHRAIAHAFTSGGRAEPQWWRARVAHAEWMALQFARRLAELKDWPVAATEWTLPAPAHASASRGRLDLRGRIDVLFAREHGAPVPAACWVADFKTGNEKALSEKNLAARLLQGHGIQVCLYALAIEQAGAREVAVSLLTPDATVAPQAPLEAIRAPAAFWDGLVRMQEGGVFGMRGAVRAEFGVSLELPLATLPIEPDLLEEKWALTHPGLAEEEADDEA